MENAKRPNVLVVAVDTQGDFIFSRMVLPVPGAEALIGSIIVYIATLDPTEVAGVLASFDTHDPDTYLGSPENLGDETTGTPGFDIHCEKGRVGWENVINLRIPHALGIPTYKIEKGVFDQWAEPHLCVERLYAQEPVRQRDAFYRRIMAQGVDTVRILGFAADYCVMLAIRGYLAFGFKVEVVARLTAGIGKDMVQTIADEFPGQVEIVD